MESMFHIVYMVRPRGCLIYRCQEMGEHRLKNINSVIKKYTSLNQKEIY
jgi:hypothetical protein